ncbi:MAG: hypothetical protein ACW976_05145, partial [Candidatus Ranarchaeia archaeon]
DQNNPISYIGNQNPWGIVTVEVIGSSDAAASELAILMFLIMFAGGLFGVTLVAVLGIYFYNKRKAK